MRAVCARARPLARPTRHFIHREHAASVCTEKISRDFRRRATLGPPSSSGGDRVKVFRGLEKNSAAAQGGKRRAAALSAQEAVYYNITFRPLTRPDERGESVFSRR